MMSYNRGNRRDNGGRRSNDYGGGGNRRGGNYRSNYDNYQVNPWEGGLPPGGNRGGGTGLLPSPNQPDLLSQLSSTEAQLAIASNLINKIFNQPQSMQPPSLLSLGGMGSGGGMSGYDDYEPRFQERRRGRMDNQRRSEPYNKSALNRRMGSDRRNIGRNRNSDKTVSKSKKDDKDSKKDKDGEKTNGEVNKPESSDEKRDGDKDGDSSDERKSKDKKYQNLPAALLYCHICSKNMWDETSFSKHIIGRRHQFMIDALNDKYKLKVELLRHEVRISEQQREMELERKERQGMKMYNKFREYCAMCDIHFYGNVISHRKNVRHQKLKAFLHPKCTHCHKEFSTRLEWDEHRLTASHLQKVAEYRRTTKPEIKDDEFDIDELANPECVNEGEMVNKDIDLITRQQSEEELVEINDDVKEKTEEEPSKEGEEKVIKEEKDEKDEVTPAATPKVEEKYNGIDLDPSKLPKYSPTLSVGQDLVKSISGFLCRGCKKFMAEEEDYKVHCRTMSHFNNYCNLVRAKARVSARKRREENSIEKAEKIEKGDEKDKLNVTDDEGNWKRRKCTKDGEEEEDGEGANANDEQMELDEDGKIEGVKTEQGDTTETDWNVVDDIDDQNVSIKEENKSQEEEEEEEEKDEEVVPKARTRGRGGKAKRGGK